MNIEIEKNKINCADCGSSLRGEGNVIHKINNNTHDILVDISYKARPCENCLYLYKQKIIKEIEKCLTAARTADK